MLETLLHVFGYATNTFTFVTTNLRAILTASAALAVIYFVVGFYNLRNELAEAKRELNAANSHVQQLKKDVQDISTARDGLSQKASELEKGRRELAEKLMKHDMSKLARRHSKLVEKAVNQGTEKTFKCFESISRGGGC